MKLLEFKQRNKLSYRGLSDLICADHATIARFFCLPKKPKDQMIRSDKYIHTIITATNGAVIPNDFNTVQNSKIIFS